MAERLKAPVCKTGPHLGFAGSNPALPARFLAVLAAIFLTACPERPPQVICLDGPEGGQCCERFEDGREVCEGDGQ